MSLGQKQTFTGTIEIRTINKGSKSEHSAVVLVNDAGGPILQMRLKGGNPFNEPKLQPFVGKRVTIEGVPMSGLAAIWVEKTSDIVVGPKPSLPKNCKPRGPKGPK